MVMDPHFAHHQEEKQVKLHTCLSAAAEMLVAHEVAQKKVAQEEVAGSLNHALLQHQQPETE